MAVDLLTGRQRAWLRREEASATASGVLACFVLPGCELRADDGTIRLERLDSFLDHFHPRFSRRVVWFGKHHAAWVELPDFDRREHLTRVTLGRNAPRSELDAFTARFLARPLTRDRPLWEGVVVEGLAEDHVAFLLKVHEALTDGAIPDPSDRAELGSHLPTAAEVRKAARQRALERLRHVGKSGRSALLERLVSVGRVLPAAARMRAPWCSEPYSGVRGVHTFSAPMEPLKKLRDQLGCTLNDVLLGLIATGLSDYFQHWHPRQDRLPVLNLVSRPGADEREISGWFLSLPLNAPHTEARVRTIAAQTERCRQQRHHLGSEWLAQLGMRFWAHSRSPVGRRSARRYLVISNLGDFGALEGNTDLPVLEMRFLGAVTSDMPITIALAGSASRINVGLHADRGAVPRFDELASAVADAFDDCARWQGRTPPPTRRAPPAESREFVHAG